MVADLAASRLRRETRRLAAGPSGGCRSRPWPAPGGRRPSCASPGTSWPRRPSPSSAVDLLKPDVEGQEHALLAACREHLRARRPTVVVEVLPGTARLRRLLVEPPRDDALARLEASEILGAALLDRFGCQD
jgi:hypothetical protein